MWLISLFVLSVMLTFSASSESAESVGYQVAKDIVYGNASLPELELQSLDVYWHDNQQKRPVIIYVHGGGWAFGDKSDVSAKPAYFLSQDMSFVSINYRLRWDYQLYDQMEDIARAILWVQNNAGTYGFDTSRIILMGNESGGHLVSLLGTDGSYLKAQNLSISDIRAVVAINTLSFDVPRVIRELGRFEQRRQHELIFGKAEEGQLAASPIRHIEAGKNIPHFALLYVSDDKSTRIQAESFARELRSARVDTIMIPGNDKDDQSINADIGRPNDPPTGALMAFIRASI